MPFNKEFLKNEDVNAGANQPNRPSSDAVVVVCSDAPLDVDRTPSTIVDDVAEVDPYRVHETQSSPIPGPRHGATRSSHYGQAERNDGEDTRNVSANHRMGSVEIRGSQMASQADTQSSDIAEMRRDLRAMMQPERLSQGDTQSQSVGRGTQGAGVDRLHPSQFATFPTKRAPPGYTAKAAKPTLRRGTVKELEKAKDGLHSSARELAPTSD